MTNPRFEWINWNSICQTTNGAVRQIKMALKAMLTADSEELAVVRQPPHGVAHRAPGCAFGSTRAVYAARPLPHARAGPQNRTSGTHAGVGRGERLVTDGGDPEYTHYCEDCELELAVLYDDREDESTPLVCGYCGGTNTRRLVATDGGTDTESERVTVRVDDPEIVAALNDAENKSEATRQALREAYGGNAERNDDDLTTSARDAYQRLVELVGREAEIDEASALSLVAQELQVEKQAVKGSVMKELRSAGYLTVRGSTVVVHQEPAEHYDDADGHHEIVAFEKQTAPTTRYGCLRCEREAGRKKHIKTRPCEIVTPEQRADTTAEEVPADD